MLPDRAPSSFARLRICRIGRLGRSSVLAAGAIGWLTSCGAPTRPSPPKLIPASVAAQQDPARWAFEENDTPPRPLVAENPEYPLALRTQGIRGTVVVEFTIGVDGRVRQASAVHAIHPVLTQLAVEAVRGWTYRPATRRGKPIEVTLRTTIDFRP